MTAAQRKLLAQLLEEEGIEAPGQQHIPRRKSDDNLQLSFAQQRLWLLDQLEPANAAYNVSRFFQLHGPLNVRALERALNEIVRRHESLRTTFTASDGVPRQVIAPFTPMRLTAVDLTGTDETTLRELATEEARRPFDLAAGPLFRAALLRLADDDHALFITMHHIVSDGWSIGVLTRELCTCYQAFATNLSAPLAELPIQYADFAQWQCEQLQGEALEKLLSYWRRQLEGAPPVLDLRMSQPRPAMQSYAGAYQMLNIDAGITRSLREIGRREHCTLYMTLLAAFAVMLSRYSDETDIVVGSPIAGRNLPELEQLIGFFVNTLVLRLDLKGDPNFLQLLQKVREVCLDAYAHQEVPFEKLVGELQPERDLSHSPLFQVMFSLQNVPDEELQLGELRLRPFDVDRGGSKFALSLIMKEVEGGLDGQISYNTDLFEADAIQRMCGHWQALLEGIAQRPEARVFELPLLAAAERQQVLIEWNQTASEYPRDKCIHQLFETQVEQTPEATALICGNDRLSYRELNSRANQLAHYLQARGVRPEQRVGILLDRTVEMIVSLLAVLKAGGVYVPLDTAYPQKRIAFMLEDAGAHALLTERSLVFGGDHSISICLDEDREQIAAQPQHNPANAAFPENLGYVIYTSGSTGRPKGVAIEHRSAVTLLHWTRENYSTVELSGVLASTSICFDLSVFEIFGPLSWGGTVILVNNVLSLLEQTHPVQLINTVPSAIDPLLKAKAIPATVSTVNLAGEELPGPLVQRLYEEAGVDRVWNLYGPSEDTTYSTAALIERGSKQKPPIGRPISDTQAYILDRYYRPVPVGVTGQLFLGGAGLAPGYLHNTPQTAKRFR